MFELPNIDFTTKFIPVDENDPDFYYIIEPGPFIAMVIGASVLLAGIIAIIVIMVYKKNKKSV